MFCSPHSWVGETNPSKFTVEIFIVNLGSWKRGQNLHSCPGQAASGSPSSAAHGWTLAHPTRNSLNAAQAWPKLTSGFSPDLDLAGIRKPFGPSFKRIEAVGKGWILMQVLRDMAKGLLPVLGCHQALWAPSTARNLGAVSHWGGGELPSKPFCWYQINTELIYWHSSPWQYWGAPDNPWICHLGEGRSRNPDSVQLLDEDFCTMVVRGATHSGGWRISEK